MFNLFMYGNKIETLFDMFGYKEDSITKSLSYLLASNKDFLNNLINTMLPNINTDYSIDNVSISSQEIENDDLNLKTQNKANHHSRTDIQIYYPGRFRIIIEAKRGYNLPSNDQLNKYATLLESKYIDEPEKFIYTLSEHTSVYAKSKLPKSLGNIKINHISYLDIINILEKSKLNFLAKEFISYLKGLIKMENKHSNIVYVVPIAKDSVNTLNSQNIYECPVGKGFPTTPPNYLGFRYNGKLQSIRHVDNVEYFDRDNCVHFKFILGDEIKPNNVKSGNIRNTKYYIDIDLLLTSSTIKQAHDLHKIRHS